MTIPIELAATNQNVIGITLYANGAPCAGATVETNINGNWMLQWDTTSVTNGTYSINLEADFGNSAVIGLSNTVTVNNLISFPYFGFNQFFNDRLWINAELSVQEADYIVDIYDDQNNYLGYFQDYTTDGLISLIWDFSAANPPFTNNGFRAVFFITPFGAVASGTPDAKKFFFREYNWNPTGLVIAFGAVDGNATTTTKTEHMVLEGVVNILDGSYAVSPAGNRAQTSAFELLPNTMNTFTNALAGSRNLYWFGHGSATTISPVNTNARVSFLSVQNLLKNFQNGTNFLSRHPYQLVFIDGCENGKGDFCTAFGIPALTASRAFFGASNLRSRAYLGFKEEIEYNTAQTIQRGSMLGGFFADWLRNLPLYTCISNATHLAVQPMPSSWVIYGATNLQRNLP